MRSPATRPQAPLSAAAWARWPDARSTRATAAADRKPVIHPVRRDLRFRRTFFCPVRRPLWRALFVEEFGPPFKIGRESGRERVVQSVYIPVVAVYLQKKK